MGFLLRLFTVGQVFALHAVSFLTPGLRGLLFTP